jgi:hypothetical protein
MGISRPRLAHDVIKLLITAMRLIIAILALVSGATNYVRQCSAPTITSSSYRTGARYSFLRCLAERPVQRCLQILGADGDRLVTFFTSKVEGTSLL